MFEPVRPLPLAAAQDYLLTRTRDLTLHEIVTWLEPVRDQIAGLEDREVRLILQLFAEYLRDRHCSPRDRRRLLVQIVNWLATDEELSKDPRRGSSNTGARRRIWRMIRRGETPSSVDTPLRLLLPSPFGQKEPLAQMN